MIQPPPQTVNGYICFDCADVALAQKGINPAHPPGSVSNPTGATPQGLDNPRSADGAGGASHSPNAVVFGGALASQTGAAASPPGQPVYQAGSQVSLQV